MLLFLKNFIIFVLSLAMLIIIHELGHFLTAKWFKVYVTEFSIGFGPAIYTKKKDGKETRFSIRAVPLGGYCAMVGESIPEFTEEEYRNLSDKDKEIVDLYKTIPENRRLDGIRKWKRAIVMVAGVVLNMLLGYALNIAAYATTQMTIGYQNTFVVSDNSAAATAGLVTGDQVKNAKAEIFIYQEDGVTLKQQVNSETFDFTKTHNEDEQNVAYFFNFIASVSPETEKDYVNVYFTKTNDITLTIPMHSVKNETSGKYSWTKIGISLKPVTRPLTFSEVMKYSAMQTGDDTIAIYKGLGMLFTKEGIKNVGGLIAIYDVSAQYTSMGINYYFLLWAMISINLAVMNLLPFPGLDGWHFLVIIIESITRKDLPKKFKNVMQTAGMIILFALMVVIMIADIVKKII